VVAGREATPSDIDATERLKRYWTVGNGGKAIAWGTPGDYDRCVTLVSAAVKGNDSFVKGYCAERHHDALGIWPATHAKEIRDAEGRGHSEQHGR